MSPLRRMAMISLVATLSILGGSASLWAQTISVTSATPNNAAQGTINLNVAIGGSGFKNGAKAQWFISGTTNPGGVTVNSTAFNSSSQLTANITVSTTATIGNFDIVVTQGTRSGKGTQLFAVTQGGLNSGCTTLGTPSGWSLTSELNYVNASGAPQYGPSLGTAVRARPVVLTAGTQSKTEVVAAAIASGRLEIFFLDPAAGTVQDGTVIVGSQVQAHITVPVSVTGRDLEVGDVDGDGTPDFVLTKVGSAVYVAMGHEDSNGILSYGPIITVLPPANSPTGFGAGLAMGILDGSPALLVGALGGGSTNLPGEVFIFQFNDSLASPGFNLIGTVNDPLPNKKNDDSFGQSVALGDVTGDGVNDLIVGAPGATINGATGAGRVFVFPAPLSATPSYFTFTASMPSKNYQLGWHVGSGVLSTSTASDVVGTTGWLTTSENVSIYSGPITASSTNPNFTLLPYPGLSAGGGGWSTNFDVGDTNGDGWTDVVVGAPNGNNSLQCSTSVGSAQLFLSTVSGTGTQWTQFVFQPPSVQTDFMGFGFGVSVVPAITGVTGTTPLLVVGEHGRDLGGVVGAGQVYVYKQQ